MGSTKQDKKTMKLGNNTIHHFWISCHRPCLCHPSIHPPPPPPLPPLRPKIAWALSLMSLVTTAPPGRNCKEWLCIFFRGGGGGGEGKTGISRMLLLDWGKWSLCYSHTAVIASSILMTNSPRYRTNQIA